MSVINQNLQKLHKEKGMYLIIHVGFIFTKTPMSFLLLALLFSEKMGKVLIALDQPFPKRQILDTSKLNEFADDDFKLDENGRNFSKWVVNTVGKGEIARYEQFLLSPQCFEKTGTADA